MMPTNHLNNRMTSTLVTSSERDRFDGEKRVAILNNDAKAIRGYASLTYAGFAMSEAYDFAW